VRSRPADAAPAPLAAAAAAPDAVRLGVPVAVRVPASSANLGPGFDSMGLALAVHDIVTVEAFPPDAGGPLAQVEVTGEGAGTVPPGEQHLVVRALRTGLARAGVPQPSLRMRCVNAIPHGKGLGSSAAAVVAGLVAARGLLARPELLDEADVFALATAAEGHPDNAAASVFGGFVLSWVEDAPGHGHLPAARHVSMPVDPRVRPVVCVPEADLPTSAARAMLPATVPHADAAFTAARAALLVEALTRRPDLLLVATEERLHQAQRGPAMPATAGLLASLRAQGVAAVVSGAGPSVLALCTSEDQVARVGAETAARREPWSVLTPEVDLRGGCLLDSAT
jgi:homoserine kinase